MSGFVVQNMIALKGRKVVVAIVVITTIIQVVKNSPYLRAVNSKDSSIIAVNMYIMWVHVG
jgi:hypothetical protein